MTYPVYTVTINIAGRGTPLLGGGESSVGHMWFELNNNGTKSSYGFAPDKDHPGQPFAPGNVYPNDSEHYLTRDFTKTVEINQSQYDAIKNFAENPYAYGFERGYDGLINLSITHNYFYIKNKYVIKLKYR